MRWLGTRVGFRGVAAFRLAQSCGIGTGKMAAAGWLLGERSSLRPGAGLALSASVGVVLLLLGALTLAGLGLLAERYMLNGMGINTGVDLDALVDTGKFISDVLERAPISRAARAILAKREP